jgi:dTDP-4-dehydrorhamnose 3,5-epimerase
VIFRETSLPGVYVVDPEPHVDERGLFTRTWCTREAREKGIEVSFVQSSVSFNPTAGTLRGLCFQLPPFEEDKLVGCVRGSIQDVVVDMRRGSPTFLQHVTVELSEGNRRSLFVPKGLAHGFLTLEPDTEVSYQMSQYYSPDHESGVRWDDPAFGIRWWRRVELLSDRDARRPDYVREEVMR